MAGSTRAPLIDFVISNDGHHVGNALPVIRSLGDAARCRVVSLCELRGLGTPAERISNVEAELIRLFPSALRRSPSSGRQTAGPARQLARRIARRASWTLVLWPRVRAWLSSRPDLVVVPNDAAFPYDFLTSLLRARGIPFLLLQEGIRFPLPKDSGGMAYGLGGANRIAAWGAGSARYFERVGIPPERLELTGCPRFDEFGLSFESLRAPAMSNRACRTVLYLPNPIDDQGFCTTAEKLDLFAQFLCGMEPLLAGQDFRLLVKLHGRESQDDYRRRADRLPNSERVVLINRPLQHALREADAAIVLASTAGLEAIMNGLPLGVLEIPGWGFVFDYVDRGAAVGLTWNQPLDAQVERLIDDPIGSAGRSAYLQHHLHCRGEASERVAQLALALALPKG